MEESRLGSGICDARGIGHLMEWDEEDARERAARTIRQRILNGGYLPGGMVARQGVGDDSGMDVCPDGETLGSDTYNGHQRPLGDVSDVGLDDPFEPAPMDAYPVLHGPIPQKDSHYSVVGFDDPFEPVPVEPYSVPHAPMQQN
eukprot:1295842-Karenia_brevis.AAC.1